jgi:hypothetical protein
VLNPGFYFERKANIEKVAANKLKTQDHSPRPLFASFTACVISGVQFISSPLRLT